MRGIQRQSKSSIFFCDFPDVKGRDTDAHIVVVSHVIENFFKTRRRTCDPAIYSYYLCPRFSGQTQGGVKEVFSFR